MDGLSNNPVYLRYIERPYSLFTKLRAKQNLPTVLCIQQTFKRHLNKLIDKQMLSSQQESCTGNKKQLLNSLQLCFLYCLSVSLFMHLCLPFSLFFIQLSSFLTSREKLKWPLGNFSSLYTQKPSGKMHLICNHNTYNWVS